MLLVVHGPNTFPDAPAGFYRKLRAVPGSSRLTAGTITEIGGGPNLPNSGIEPVSRDPPPSHIPESECVTPLVMQRDVQTLRLLFFGHSQSDHGIDDLEDYEAQYGCVDHRQHDTEELHPYLSGHRLL